MTASRRVVKVIDSVLNAVEQAISLVSGVALLAILIYAAVGRYVLGYGAPEETELSWLFFLWLCFFGSSALVRTGDHPSVGVLFDRIARRGLRGRVYASLTRVACIVFAASIMYGIYRMYPIISVSVTTMLRLPLTIYYAAALGGLSFLILRYSIRVLQYLTPGE